MKENEDPVREFYRWNALLRSVGAYEAYQELYKQAPTPDRVAELLILRSEVPRSLRASVEEVEALLGSIEGNAGREPRLLTAVQHAKLRFGTRITSYNVCYTKLLRLKLKGRSSPKCSIKSDISGFTTRRASLNVTATFAIRFGVATFAR